MIEQIILVVHVLIAIAIVGLILLQQGKGADMGASFGGGGSQTLFGASGGGNVLTRATAILATLFFVSSFGLAIIAKQKASDVSGADSLLSDQVVIESVDPVEDAVLAEEGAMVDSVDDLVPVPGALDDAAALDSEILDEIPE